MPNVENYRKSQKIQGFHPIENDEIYSYSIDCPFIENNTSAFL